MPFKYFSIVTIPGSPNMSPINKILIKSLVLLIIIKWYIKIYYW
ncbi:Hypothetical protein MCYN_0044 [Mycoplasmopsis cynos C142]|uniref:Uncharacterized protein n=1 Tax=Mycoplasmopsis cynos (strain C142) TaxID=1246955 RepID=L0RVX9_MYCC1|nr:Hypothetical protein MCYN_0044 [Mycoplasmopsis cynos C142]